MYSSNCRKQSSARAPTVTFHFGGTRCHGRWFRRRQYAHRTTIFVRRTDMIRHHSLKTLVLGRESLRFVWSTILSSNLPWQLTNQPLANTLRWYHKTIFNMHVAHGQNKSLSEARNMDSNIDMRILICTSLLLIHIPRLKTISNSSFSNFCLNI